MPAVFLLCAGLVFSAIGLGLWLDSRLEKRGYILRRGPDRFWNENDR